MGYALPMLLLALIAARFDLLTGKIPNTLILAGVTSGLCVSFLIRGTEGLIISCAGFGVGMLLMMPGYLLRFTGAGDLKLLATLGIFCGPLLVIGIFASAVVAGALFILSRIASRAFEADEQFLLRYSVMLQSLLIGKQFIYLPSGQDSILKRRLPMAPFYAVGCVIVMLVLLIDTGS